MLCSLSGLQRRGDLGVRGGKKAGDLLGQRLVGGETSELALPEVKITPGQAVEIGGVVVSRSHGATIADRAANAAFAGAKRALSHCGISAKVTRSAVNGRSPRSGTRSKA